MNPDSTHESLSRHIKENNWGSLLDNLPDGILVLDNRHRVVYANRALCRLKNWKREDFKNKQCYEIIHGLNSPPDFCPHSKLLSDGKEHFAQVFEPLLGGHCMVSVSPVFGQKGVLTGCIHVVRDINAGKNAEEVIRKSEEKYRLLTENAKEMIISVNLEAQITFANRTALKISGYTMEEIIGRTLKDIMPENQHELLENLKQQRLAGNRDTFFYETAFINKSGDIVPVEVSSGLLTENGQPSGALISARDITQRKQIEDQLKQSEDKYRHLVENLSVGILMSQDLRVVFANDRICEFLGYTRQELLDHNTPFDIIHPDDRDMVLNNTLRRMKGEQFDTTYPFRVLDKEGRAKWVESTNTTTTWEGRPASLNFFVDISGRMKSQERQEYLEQRLIHAQKLEAVGILAGGIAHDFNNLLSVILGNIELAQIKDRLGEDNRFYFSTAKEMCHNAKTLTSQLITFSEGGTPVKKRGNIAALVGGLLSRRKNNPLYIYRDRMDKDLWPVLFDPGQLRQTLNNLMDNAQEAMPDGGFIDVVVENIKTEQDIADMGFLDQEPDRMIRIEIADQGKGIPEEVMGRIFDPYFSSKPMGARKGTGLGLTIAYSIVKQHGGFILAKSELGMGSRFSVYLPVLKE
jgi:PAS domain S-box-containing protein